MSKKTGFLYDELCMWHDPGSGWHKNQGQFTIEPYKHPESPETKRRLRNLLAVSGLLEQLTPIKASPATIEDVLRFHTPEYIGKLQQASTDGCGNAGDDAPFSQGAFDIALHSAGMTIQALRSVLLGEVDNAYSLSRPPGHHAKADAGSGFCLLGNIPIAIKTLQAESLVKRVAVIDWDVHHGDGTQSAFYDDPDVLTLSIHQGNIFPANSGGVEETGVEKGEGYNINVPLPAGCGNGAYQATLDDIIIPALNAFKPEVIIVACGFDAAAIDPLGRMALISDGYREMTKKIMQAADDLCYGKLVFTHEGGYSEVYVPFCGLAVIEQLSHIKTDIVDTIGAEIAMGGGQELLPHQREAIDKALPLVKKLETLCKDF